MIESAEAQAQQLVDEVAAELEAGGYDDEQVAALAHHLTMLADALHRLAHALKQLRGVVRAAHPSIVADLEEARHDG